MTLAGLLSQVLQVALALALAPLLVGWINQCRAWLQNRSAPSMFLPSRTIRKLFMKDAVVAENASPIFRTMPYVVFGAVVAAGAVGVRLLTRPRPEPITAAPPPIAAPVERQDGRPHSDSRAQRVAGTGWVVEATTPASCRAAIASSS